MQTLLSTLRVITGALLAFAVFVITLPITLFVTLSALVVGSVVALQMKERLAELQRSIDTESVDDGPVARPANRRQHNRAVNHGGVVIDQVKIDGVWQSR